MALSLELLGDFYFLVLFNQLFYILFILAFIFLLQLIAYYWVLSRQKYLVSFFKRIDFHMNGGTFIKIAEFYVNFDFRGFLILKY